MCTYFGIKKIGVLFFYKFLKWLFIIFFPYEMHEYLNILFFYKFVPFFQVKRLFIYLENKNLNIGAKYIIFFNKKEIIITK